MHKPHADVHEDIFLATRTLFSPAHAKPTVAVIGVGYVGLPLALLSSEHGYKTIGYDIDEEKITSLRERRANYISEEEQEALRRDARIRFESDESVLKEADIFLICVPTPVHENRLPNLEPLRAASEMVGRRMRAGSLVIVESTVNPGACEEVSLKALEEHSGLKAEVDFFFAHCPERVNPGDTTWNTRTIPRVVGASGSQSLERAVAFYRDILEGDVLPMPSIKEAEAVKMVENAFRDVNIAFVNELAMSFGKMGIDIVHVLRGASTKPFSFLPHFPGCGVGGHCIPVDPYYLIRYAKKNGFTHEFLMTARKINTAMPRYTVQVLERALKSKKRKLRGSRVALLGLAYKRDIPDTRESPAVLIRDLLKKRGVKLEVFDPHVPEQSTSESLEAALRQSDAALIATDHTLFRSLTPEKFERHNISIVVDGRNCLRKRYFKNSEVLYRGIGR